MVRTLAGAQVGEAPKKSKKTGESSRSSSQNGLNSSERGFGGFNSVCRRETPDWQRPITNFFCKQTRNEQEKGDKVSEDSVDVDSHKQINKEVINVPEPTPSTSKMYVQNMDCIDTHTEQHTSKNVNNEKSADTGVDETDVQEQSNTKNPAGSTTDIVVEKESHADDYKENKALSKDASNSVNNENSNIGTDKRNVQKQNNDIKNSLESTTDVAGKEECCTDNKENKTMPEIHDPNAKRDYASFEEYEYKHPTENKAISKKKKKKSSVSKTRY